MILLISDEPVLVSRTRSVIDAHLLDVRRAVPESQEMQAVRVAIVSISRPERDHGADVLREIAERAPHVIRIAVVGMRRSDMHLACRAGANDVVFEDEIEDELAALLRRFDSHRHQAPRPTGSDVRHLLARRIANGSVYSPFLRHVISSALRSPARPRTVTDLAICCQRPRSTLQYHWHREISATGGPTLHRFLRWILLLHATECSRYYSTLSSLAAELRVEPRTLRSSCLRLVGDLPTLRESDSTEIAHQLRFELEQGSRNVRARRA